MRYRVVVLLLVLLPAVREEGGEVLGAAEDVGMEVDLDVGLVDGVGIVDVEAEDGVGGGGVVEAAVDSGGGNGGSGGGGGRGMAAGGGGFVSSVGEDNDAGGRGYAAVATNALLLLDATNRRHLRC